MQAIHRNISDNQINLEIQLKIQIFIHENNTTERYIAETNKKIATLFYILCDFMSEHTKIN